MATILVEILGNAKQFKSELDSAVASTEKANTGFGKMQKVAGVAGLAIAGGLAVGLDKAVGAAEEAQASTARMNTAFAASHVSAKQFAGGIEEAEGKARSLGFTNDSVKNSLGSLVIATHNGHKAITDLGVAQDIARFKHVSLETATKTLTMAMAGSSRATKQLGIDVPKVTTHYDALKAQFGSTITASEKLELAHAKLQDRMSTSNAVIATVSEKLHGQAEAFSKTSEGGMEQFHAQMNNLEENIGKALLPAITTLSQDMGKLAKFFSDHTEVTKLLVIGLGALAGVLIAISAATKLASAAQTIASAATKVWTAGQWLLNAALDANPIGLLVIAIAALIGGLILAYQHSATFRNIVKGAFDDVKQAGQVVADFFTKTLPAAFDDVKSAASGFASFFTKTLPAAFNTVIGWIKSNWPIIATLISGPWAPIVALATNAFGIRSALIGAFTGIKNAITSLLSGLIGDVTSIASEIGGAIIDGIENGMGDITHVIGNFLAKGLHGAIGVAKSALSILSPSKVTHDEIGAPMAEGVIEGWLSSSASLPSKMSQSLQNAINAGRGVIQAAQATFQTAWQQLAGDADTAFRGITGAVQTPAEKTLSTLQDAHDQAQRTQALTDAQAQLTTAQAGGDPAAIAQAQQAVADASYNIQVAALEKQAALQRTQLDARNALRQRNFDTALSALEAHLAKAHSTYADAHTAILKLFKSYGINYANAGGELGDAFITGLRDSIKKAAKGAGALSGTLSDVAAGIHVPHAATGGVVSQTGLAVIHQGETITPSGGGGTVNITVNGWVGSDQAIAEKLRNELIRLGRNTTGGVLGGFA